ncbi:RNA-binding protein [Candidatus Dojkabacteria bacterium]|nr:RNA-binding protein [Candidatus Dojkabacteria bacterium]
MSNMLFVGNIPWSSTEESLKDWFEKAGKVKEVSIAKFKNGRFKGFAFVTMEDEVNVEDVIKSLDGKAFEGRSLRIEVSTSKRQSIYSDGSDSNVRIKQKSKNIPIVHMEENRNANSIKHDVAIVNEKIINHEDFETSILTDALDANTEKEHKSKHISGVIYLKKN